VADAVSVGPAAARRRLPIWLMAMTNAPFGMYGGVLVISIPALLNARHVPAATIAAMTAMTISPGFWSIVASPMLDVRFSRRWYSMATALAAAALLAAGILALDQVGLAEVLLTLGFFAGNLYQSALGGWLSSVTTAGERNALSAWLSIANISGGGAMAILAGQVFERCPPPVAAAVLAGTLLVPTALFPWIDAPGPDRRLASESFRQFAREVVGIVRRPRVLLALGMFVVPAASFALVNLLAELGSEYHASQSFVGAVGGAGVVLAGIVGCLAFRLVDRLLPLRQLYLAIGIIGAAFTMALLLLPRTPTSFAIALIGENVFQSAAMTTAIAITFETIGPRNPLAATTFSVIVSVLNIPNTYMVRVDGWGYEWRGVAGSLIVDAGLGIVFCVALALLLARLARLRHPAIAPEPLTVAPVVVGEKSAG